MSQMGANVGSQPQLLDQLVGASEQRQRYGEAERIGCPEVDDELKFCRQLHRKIGRLGVA